MNRLQVLVALLLLKALLIMGVILTSGIGLGPEEAQYWCWSQALDIGYYSKPPGIAWQIWMGCKLFGNSELGVRFFAVVFSFFESLSVYALARACGLCTKTAFWAALVMAVSPLGMMGSMLAITDGGLVLFWTLAATLFAKALRDERTPNYYLLGGVLFCGALFKWPIYFFWLYALLFLPFYPFLRSRHLIGGFFLSAAGLIPSLIWNLSHHFATFRHVWFTLIRKQKEAGTTPLATGNVWDFIGGQALLLSPILFLLLVGSLVAAFRYWKTLPSPLRFCCVVTVGLLFPFLFISIFKKMQGNWVVFAYPTAVIVICWVVSQSRAWLHFGVASALATSAFMFGITYIQAHNLFLVPYRLNPFVHYVGWKQLNQELKEHGYKPEEHFLFSDKYQMASILSFYSPEQRRAYFLNMQKSRKNQFSFWPSLLEEQLGKSGYFVLVENIPYLHKAERIIEKEKKDLEAYFSRVEFLGLKPLFFSHGELVKAAMLFKCEEYNGKLPEETFLY